MNREANLSCPACGQPQPTGADFCSGCGAHLGTIGKAERRVISVLFADLCGFTRITERLDPEAVHELAASCLEPLAECATRWGGYVDKFIGDSVMALFGVPVGHENEPERAIRASLEMRETLEAWDPGDRFSIDLADEARPRLGIGVTTGPVVTGLFSAGGTSDYTAVGDVVNVAARLESACEPGQILVGERTYRETRELFEFDEGRVLEVRGREESVRARRVRGRRKGPPATAPAGGRDRELVNREGELEQLRREWDRASGGETRGVLVAGRAGIGKSRLIEELVDAEDLEGGDVARGRSHPHSGETAWGALSDLLRALYDLSAEQEPRRAAARLARSSGAEWTDEQIGALAAALGRDARERGDRSDRPGPYSTEAVGEAVTKAIRAAGSRPRLLWLENAHWADRSSQEYVARWTEGGSAGPRLLVATARPPLPGEEGLKEIAESSLARIDLGPLDLRESRELLEGYLGDGHDLPERFVERILSRAEGNPLFLEELLDSLAERGTIRRDDGTWRLHEEPESLGVPDGVEQVLSSRMDALPYSSKRLLQCASVAGRRFWPALLADELLGRDVADDLERLRVRGLIREAGSTPAPAEPAYEFRHGFLREVAYRSLLRSTRAELHGAVARWLEERGAAAIPDYHRRVAHHWERSGEDGRAEAHRTAAREETESGRGGTG